MKLLITYKDQPVWVTSGEDRYNVDRLTYPVVSTDAPDCNASNKVCPTCKLRTQPQASFGCTIGISKYLKTTFYEEYPELLI